MRKPIIAGNWKMNLLQNEGRELFEGIKSMVSGLSESQLPEIVVAPTFTSISVVASAKAS